MIKNSKLGKFVEKSKTKTCTFDTNSAVSDFSIISPN